MATAFSADLGNVLASGADRIPVTWEWANTTNETWRTAKVLVSSGCCVSVRQLPETVRPGGHAKFTMIWQQQERYGNHRWFATVFPSSAAQNPVQLTASANVVPRVEIDIPQSGVKTCRNRPFEIAGRVSIRARADEPPPVLRLDFSDGAAKLGRPLSATGSGKEQVWTADLLLAVAPKSEARFYTGKLLVTLDSPASRAQSSVAWEVLPDVQLEPRFVVWNVADVDDKVFQVRHNVASAAKSKVLSVKAPPGMKVGTVENGKIVVSLGNTLAGSHRLVVNTDSGEAAADIVVRKASAGL